MRPSTSSYHLNLLTIFLIVALNAWQSSQTVFAGNKCPEIDKNSKLVSSFRATVEVDRVESVCFGSFTSSSATEAIIETWGGDSRIAHHTQWRLWQLQRANNKWRVIRSLYASCRGKITAVDVEGDHRLELLIESGCSHQGYDRGEILLVRVGPLEAGQRRILYAATTAEDDTEYPGGITLQHNLEFSRPKDGGPLRIFDTVESARSIDHPKISWRHRHVYLFKGNRYRLQE